MVRCAIEYEVVSLPAAGEILLGVIDHMVSADRSDHVHIPRAAHTGHGRAERFGDLHGERTYPARRTVYQDLLPRLNPSLIAKTLKGAERPCNGDRSEEHTSEL